MLAFANAKINLGLNIIGKRPDGYHELETVFYPVEIHDVVELTDSDELSLDAYGLAIPGAAADNICLKAYEALKRDFDLPPQRISLFKNIPVGAGLGGGSSDAAFVVKLANDKFNLGLTEMQMMDYVRPLGADCAFFIRNTPVFAHGKGDEFSEVSVDLKAWSLVLVKPDIHVSTAEAYAGIQVSSHQQPLKELIQQPIASWRGSLVNDFERSVFAKYPEIEQIKTELYEAGATFAAMSGSGSSVFGIFDQQIKLPDLEDRHKVFYNI